MTKTRRKVELGAEGQDRIGGTAGPGDCVGHGTALPGSPDQTYAWKKQLQEHASMSSIFCASARSPPAMRRRAEVSLS